MSNPLKVILIIGFMVRLLVWGWFRNEPLRTDDEREYSQLAVSLLNTGEYRYPGSAERTSLRPPLYPWFVSMIYRFMGVENYQSVRFFQLVLSLATVTIVYALAYRLYDRRTACWAAGMTCFYPSLLAFNNLLLTEILFAFWCALACLFHAQYIRDKKPIWLVLAGATWGLGALTRSVLWLFPPLLLLYQWFACRDMPWLKRVVVASTPILALAVVIAPWSWRNTQLHRTFTAVDVMGGRNFMMGNYEYTPLYRMWDAIGIQDERAWHRVLAREYPEASHMTQGERDKLAMKYGLKFVLRHPVLTLQRTVVRFFNFWQLERSIVAGLSRGWWGNLPRYGVAVIAAAIWGSYALAMISAIFGIFVLPSKEARLHCLVLLLIGFICAAHSAVFAHSRYHKSLMPIILIYSAHGVLHWRELLSRRRTAACAAAGMTAMVLVSSWLFEAIVVEMPRRAQTTTHSRRYTKKPRIRPSIQAVNRFHPTLT